MWHNAARRIGREPATPRGDREHGRQVRRSLRAHHRRAIRRMAEPMKARVAIDVMLKDGILDPQGKTVEESLPSLGFDGVSGVRIGKHIALELEVASRED